jgi:hypothetical protein
MSINQKILIRHIGKGHLRFSIPPELVHPEVIPQLEQGLLKLDAIYRVDVFASQRKLSIRYTEGMTDLSTVAKALAEVVAGIEFPPPERPCCAALAAAEPKGVKGWLKTRFSGVENSLRSKGLIDPDPDRGLALTPDNEKFVMDFFTDILVLYLIKLHWHLITTEWLKRPWFYRNEWLATFYLIFLLVKSKRPK